MKTKSNNWIKCSDKMPEIKGGFSDNVLVFTDDGDILIAYLESGCEFGEWTESRDDSDIYDLVTHWQPLPNAPIEEEAE